MSENWLQQAIERQRTGLSARLQSPFARIAEHCGNAWGDPEAINRGLMDDLNTILPCNLLYAIDSSGIQVSANVGPDDVDTTAYRQNLSSRPYLPSNRSSHEFQLSEVYISRVTARPCITALQTITKKGQIVGYVAGDFSLRDLPLLTGSDYSHVGSRQIKGDPSIRETVFSQQRTESEMDRHMSEVISIVDELLGERGVFHAKLHFSSSRATLWLTDDPFRYRVHVLKEIIEPDVCLAYPQRPYPDEAVIDRDRISDVFKRFALLRNLDETIYLRSGSLNLMNGMVSLTFSCDGTYYLPVDEFFDKDECFWLGS